MKVLRAKNVREAIELQQSHKGHYLAGGTDIMVGINSEKFQPECLIDLSLCQELYGIVEEAAIVKIGALTTFTELEKSETIQQFFPALAKAAASVGGPQIRNRGTVGGNICNASPAADTVPALVALHAVAVVEGCNGERQLPVEKLLVAPRQTCLAQDEIVRELILPKNNSVSDFMKVGKRNALAISSINMAVAVIKEAGKIQEICVAIGSAAPTVRNCVRAAACLKEGGISAMEEAQQILMEEIAPIDDRWATAEYRRMVACNMLESLAVALMEEKDV